MIPELEEHDEEIIERNLAIDLDTRLGYARPGSGRQRAARSGDLWQ
jgi:hypothetical protein